jgi:hypothetical protein
MWRIWLAPDNASTWQMGFNVAFKGLTEEKFQILALDKNNLQIIFAFVGSSEWDVKSPSSQSNMTSKTAAIYT